MAIRDLRNWCASLIACGSLTLPSACAWLPKETQENLISAGVSVSVVPWQSAEAALLSSVKLTDEQAYAMVLPTVGASANSRLTASRAGLSVNLSPGALVPTSLTTITGSDVANVRRTGTQPADEPPEGTKRTMSESTDTTLVEGPAPGPGRTEVDLSDFTALDPGLLAAALQDDPFRRFAAAAALRAQVQLLDARVRQASAQSDLQPYLVQLEITANPRRRDLPYDLHSTISFELYGEDGNPRPGNLEIIPLFSNVDFERINLSDLAESIRQASLDVGATFGSVGFGAGGGTGAREQARFVARNLNALTSVTRVTGQEMDIRTGARWVGDDAYKLLAPSQTVIALMLVDKTVVDRRTNSEKKDDEGEKGELVLRTIARQQLVDGADGQDLRLGDRATYHGKIQRIVDSFNLELRRGTAWFFCNRPEQKPIKDEIPGLTTLDHQLGDDPVENARILIQEWLARGDDANLDEGLRCLAGDPTQIDEIRRSLTQEGTDRVHEVVEDFRLRLRRTPGFYCNWATEQSAIDEISSLIPLMDSLGDDPAENARITIQKRLADAWLMDDDDALNKGLNCLSGDPTQYQNIRLELASLKRSTQYSIDQNRLPLLKPVTVPKNADFEKQLVYYASNDRGINVRIGLNGPANLEGVQAYLTLDDKLKKTTTPQLLAQAVAATDSALTLTFPPIGKKRFELKNVELKDGDSSLATLDNLFDVEEAKSEQPNNRVILSTGLVALGADARGRAGLLVTVGKEGPAPAERLRLTAEGGQVTAIEGAARGKESAFELGFERTYPLALQNLVPGQILSLKGQALDAKGDVAKDFPPVEERLFIVPGDRAQALPQVVVAPAP